tara:strand:+ start:829 stop:1230 length:402 start_codon:yes stop_codon:yes gene_type:complete
MVRVYADVVGDLFHVGHINLFKQARELGDYLIVGVHSDKAVSSYKRVPILDENTRYEIVKNCRLVDQVIIDAPLTLTKTFIRDNKIDIVAHGNDTNPNFEEQHKAAIDMGIMRYLKYTPGISTTDIINKIKEL